MIFFDFRAIHAGTAFLHHLRSEHHEAIKKHGAFLREAALESLKYPPPIGFFREFIVDRSGEHNHQLDLKKRGLRPIIEAARIQALNTGIDATNTLERLAAINKAGILGDSLYLDIKEAYNLINHLRIVRYLDARAKNQQPDNFIDPRSLNSLQRNMLKESFVAIARLQKNLLTLISQRFI